LVNAPKSQDVWPLGGDTASISRKRRRTGDEVAAETFLGQNDFPPLHTPEALEAIVCAYFSHVHPWIPMIHQARFRNRIQDPMQRPKLEVVLRAMEISASKFVPNEGIAPDVISPAWSDDFTRRWVVSTAMD
jgi:hypothetical protein